MLAPFLRGLTFLAFCALGAVTLDVLLKTRPPLASPATSASPSSNYLDESPSAEGLASAQGDDLSPKFVRPNTARERFAKIIAGATQLAADSFPTFVILDSGEPPDLRSEFSANGASAYWRQLQRRPRARRNADLEFRPAGAAAQVERPLERTVRETVYSLIDRGLYAAAIAQLDRVMADARPSRDELQLLLALKGQLYYSLNETKMSVKLLDEAIRLAPKSRSGRRATDAKYEVARLLQKRAPRRRPEPPLRTARTKTVNAGIDRERRLGLSAPTILAVESDARHRHPSDESIPRGINGLAEASQ